MRETIKSLPPSPTFLRKYYDLTVNCRLEEEYIPVVGDLFRKSSKWEAVVSKPYGISGLDLEVADEPVTGVATAETPEQAIYLAVNQFMVRRQVSDAAKAKGRK